MKVTKSSRRWVRLQNIFFVVLLLVVVGMLAWLSERHNCQADWTANARNTLAPASIEVLGQLQGVVTARAFTADSGALQQSIADLLGRYQRHKDDLNVAFVDPNQEPELLRQLAITVDGELVLEYQGRVEHVTELNEQALTNALHRLSRAAERWVVFVEGHGERNVFGQANHDLQLWGQQLEAKGFSLQTINLATQALVPDNTAVLVIAGPQVDYLPGEVALIEAYLERGGKLLWLADPEGVYGLESLAEYFGIAFEDGVIVDPSTQMYSINDPTFAIVGDYGFHPLVEGFNMSTIFPRAAGLVAESQDDWQADELLLTTAGSWSETGVLAGEVGFDAGEDVAGPLALAVALQRSLEATEDEQRALVVGDGDFLSNAYLGNGANLDLGMNMLNWLSRDDQLIAIPSKTAVDASLNLSQTASMVIGFGFLLLLPLLLLASGLLIWLKRRKA